MVAVHSLLLKSRCMAGGPKVTCSSHSAWQAALLAPGGLSAGAGLQQGLQGPPCCCCAACTSHQLDKSLLLCWPLLKGGHRQGAACLPRQQHCRAAPVQALDAAVRSFEPHLETLASTLLRQLLTPGQMFPDLAQPLAELEQATDWGEAVSTGRVVPAKVGAGITWVGLPGQSAPSGHAERGTGGQLWAPPAAAPLLPYTRSRAVSLPASRALWSGRTWARSVQQSHAIPDRGAPLPNVMQGGLCGLCTPHCIPALLRPITRHDLGCGQHITEAEEG